LNNGLAQVQQCVFFNVSCLGMKSVQYLQNMVGTAACSTSEVTKHGAGLVSSEISDFTPCAHAQSDILHIKYAEKADD